MPDVLELPRHLDVIIGGLIRFFYGAAKALIRVLLCPVRGSAECVRGRAGISSVSALFLSAVLLSALVVTIDTGDWANLRAVTQGRGLGTFLLFVSVFYVYFDLLAVGVAAIAARPRSRRSAEQRLRFGLAAGGLASGLLGLLLEAPAIDLWPRPFQAPLEHASLLPEPANWIILPAMLAAPFYPLLRIAFRIVRQRTRRPRLAASLAFIASAVVGVPLALIGFVGVILAAFGLSQSLWESNSAPVVQAVTCSITADRTVHITAAITNPSDQAIALTNRDFAFELRDAARAMTLFGLQPDFAKEGIVVIPPRQASTIDFIVQAGDSPDASSCRLWVPRWPNGNRTEAELQSGSGLSSPAK